MSTTPKAQAIQIHELFIRTTAARLWAALTKGEETQKYFFGTRVSSTLERGAPIVYAMPDGSTAVEGEILEVAVMERLIYTWNVRYDAELSKETSKVTWLIEQRGDACMLTAIHDLTNAPKVSEHVTNEGWSMVLSGLKTLLETGIALKVGPKDVRPSANQNGGTAGLTDAVS